ncbi:MAG: hypothetical protein JST82_13685 [Bacteroidetes bacterium]|nr:hypothetical protein [Bacteroidota bacterium]
MVKEKALRQVIAIEREQAEHPTSDIFTQRVSIEELRSIWNDKNRQYSDDELYQIREWLYVMAGAIVHTIENTPAETLESIRNTKATRRINKNALVFIESNEHPLNP